MIQVLAGDARVLTEHEEEIVRLCATNLLEIVPRLGEAMARHLHRQVPELGALGDAAALDAKRRSCVANMREICIMLRAGMPATAHETPPDALEYARFLRSRGVGPSALRRAYQLGAAMFRPVAAAEFERCTDDRRVARRVMDHVAGFVWVYVDRVTQRLGEEYGTDRGAQTPDIDDPVWREPTSVVAAAAFIVAEARRPGTVPDAAAGDAHRTAHEVLTRFGARVEAAGRSAELAQRLARADTSVRVELADEPDLAIALLLGAGGGVAVTHGGVPTETSVSLSSVDLERLPSAHFNLPMAIARGRAEATGPVRKFLRVMPIIRTLPDPGDAPQPDAAFAERIDPAHGETSRLDGAAWALLDHASADSRRPAAPGDQAGVWSVEWRGVHTRVGAERVLDGLDVTIPEGMVTVVLGPSGRARRALISHVLGLAGPDRGEVLVDGRPVATLSAPALRALRRRVAVRFADGALFDGTGQRIPVAPPDAEILVFDEPRSQPDPMSATSLCELIRRQHTEHGGTSIVLTHDVAIAREIAEYLVVLWRGRLVQSGDRDDIFTSPNPYVRQFLAGPPRTEETS